MTTKMLIPKSSDMVHALRKATRKIVNSYADGFPIRCTVSDWAFNDASRLATFVVNPDNAAARDLLHKVGEISITLCGKGLEGIMYDIVFDYLRKITCLERQSLGYVPGDIVEKFDPVTETYSCEI